MASYGYAPLLVVLKTKPRCVSCLMLLSSATCDIKRGMSTALGHPRPLNSMLVSSLKKLSMPIVEMACWLIGMFDSWKICSRVVMPCIIAS